MVTVIVQHEVKDFAEWKKYLMQMNPIVQK